MLVCFYLLLLLHITEGCRLEGNRDIKPITAHTGGSVLLPCTCTDLHNTPETFTWKKYTVNDWVKISPESEQYKDRFQLVNHHSSGNLSLLISHLTEEDDGDYSCSVKDGDIRYIRLSVKGCTLNKQIVKLTGYVGQSVLLPCSCSELQAKPHTFTWKFNKNNELKEIFPKDQTNHYTDRVQIFNDHDPGNLSLLISHLTVEDGGWYRCSIKEVNIDVRLTVKEAPTRPLTSTTTSKRDVTTAEPNVMNKGTLKSEIVDKGDTTVIISSGVVVVLLLLLILGGVMYWKRRGQSQGQSESSDGQTEQRTQPVTQKDTEVMYAVIHRQTKHKKAEEKDEVTYSTVVHSNTVRAAHTPAASEESTVYASINTK